MTILSHSREFVPSKSRSCLAKYFEARHATVYIGNVPVFYFPYYRRSLEKHENTFVFIPGYRSVFGPYLLSSYHWFLNEELSGVVHVDYRELRGIGEGPDFNYNLGTLGEGTLKNYYTHDQQPGLDPITNLPLPSERYRVYFSYDAAWQTNLTVKSQVAIRATLISSVISLKRNTPGTFNPIPSLMSTKSGRNWSLDGIVQPRVNAFDETIERLPEIQLSGFRQQIFSTPLVL